MPDTPATLVASSRSPRTRRANRLLLALIGLILLLAGAAGIAAGLGAFGSSFADQDVLSSTTRRFADDNSSWFWPVAGLVGIIVALLCLRWLVIQLRSNKIGSLPLERDRRTGSTVVQTGAVCTALADEIADMPGVDAVGAQLVGKAADPALLVRVRLDGRADIAALRRQIESEGIEHVRMALDAPQLPVRIELTLPKAEARSIA